MSTESSYTFKEVCDLTGYRASVIRYYEKEFKLSIPRDSNGRRIFTNKELETLLFIKKLQEDGYTNTQIKKKFEADINIQSEVAATAEGVLPSAGNDLLEKIDERLSSITMAISELNQNICGMDKDVILSENLKLKMEIKQKSYEIIQLKEKLRFEKEKRSGFLSRIFKRST